MIRIELTTELVYDKQLDISYPNDVTALMLAWYEKGYFLTRKQAIQLWSAYCNSKEATWLVPVLAFTEDMWNYMKQFWKEGEEI